MKDKLLEGSMLVKGNVGQEEFHIVEDHEEEEEHRDEILKLSVEQIILGYLPFGIKIPLAALGNMSRDVHKKYQEMLQEASRLSREQIIKIIRGTQPTEEQKKFDIINCKGYDKRAGNKPTDEYYEWRWMLDGIEDPDLYTIFSIIRDNPI